MIDLQNACSVALISAGVFFIFTAGVGLIRLPDFYSRTHAVSKADALGIMLIILGLIVHEGFSINSLKLFYIFVSVAIANPIGSHAIGHAALKRGQKPLLGSVHRKDEAPNVGA